jgi:molybdenum cofactor biosynthesis enzyme MoaA
MDSYSLSCQAAVATLHEKYEIIAEPIDLSVLNQADGHTIVFDLLHKLHRPCYSNNQRIIVIQPELDVYNYSEDQAGASLIFLQQCLQKIDISNFFVVVISCNPKIEQELDWIRTNHSGDDCAIQYHLIHGKYVHHRPQQQTFCVMPWMHLHVNTNLEIAPCCIADQSMTWGSLLDNDTLHLINCDSARNMRLKMLSNQRCKECHTCYEVERNGCISKRQTENLKYQSLIPRLKTSTSPDGSLPDYDPIQLDIRLTNTCNLKCRTCDGQYSSQLAQEEHKLFDNKTNLLRIKSMPDRSRAFDKIKHYIDCAEEIYFAGGEPIIMFEHYKILDRLVELERFDVALAYNTNFTALKFKKICVLDYWKKFHKVRVGASIDGHSEVFEYVRHGAKWADIEKNYQLLKKECPHVDFVVTSTVSLYSAQSIMELQRMWHEDDILNIRQFEIRPVSPSDHFSIQTLLPHHKKDLSDKIETHCAWLREQDAYALIESWQGIKQMMWQSDQSYRSKLLAHVNRKRDRARGENFERIYPQYKNLFTEDDVAWQAGDQS